VAYTHTHTPRRDMECKNNDDDWLWYLCSVEFRKVPYYTTVSRAVRRVALNISIFYVIVLDITLYYYDIRDIIFWIGFPLLTVIVVCHLWIYLLRRHVVRIAYLWTIVIRHLTVCWKLFTDGETHEYKLVYVLSMARYA